MRPALRSISLFLFLSSYFVGAFVDDELLAERLDVLELWFFAALNMQSMSSDILIWCSNLCASASGFVFNISNSSRLLASSFSNFLLSASSGSIAPSGCWFTILQSKEAGGVGTIVRRDVPTLKQSKGDRRDTKRTYGFIVVRNDLA